MSPIKLIWFAKLWQATTTISYNEWQLLYPLLLYRLVIGWPDVSLYWCTCVFIIWDFGWLKQYCLGTIDSRMLISEDPTLDDQKMRRRPDCISVTLHFFTASSLMDKLKLQNRPHYIEQSSYDRTGQYASPKEDRALSVRWWAKVETTKLFWTFVNQSCRI